VGASLVVLNSLSRSLLLPLMQADSAAAASTARRSPRIADDGDRSIDLVLLMVIGCALGGVVPGLFTLTCMCSGYVLGTFVGAVAANIGTLAGVAVCFALTRRCFHDAAAAFVEARLPSAHAIAQRPTAKAVATSWFLPVPMAVKVLFWASCSVIPWPRFIGAASVVLVPHVVMLAWVGDQARRLRDHAERRRDGAVDATEVLALFAGAGGVVAAYVVVTAWVRRRANASMTAQSCAASASAAATSPGPQCSGVPPTPLLSTTGGGTFAVVALCPSGSGLVGTADAAA
jgi:uncharacterized membrane protein YdjX (TVP38/TMEM64 family)